MDISRRVLSALAGHGLAFVFGAGMAVAAGGVFTAPDPVAMTPSPAAVQLVELPRTPSVVADALTHGAAPSPSPAPSETAPPAGPPRDGLHAPEGPPRDGLHAPEGSELPVLASPPISDAGPLPECRQARSRHDGDVGECDRPDGDRRHSGHHHDDEFGDDAERTGHHVDGRRR